MKQKLNLLWTIYRGLDWPFQVFGAAVALIVVSALIQAAVF